MDLDIRSENGKANAGMATGITALGLLQNGGLGGLLGGGRQNAADMGIGAALGALAAMKQIPDAGIKIDVPILGEMTLYRQDMDALYQFIV